MPSVESRKVTPRIPNITKAIAFRDIAINQASNYVHGRLKRENSMLSRAGQVLFVICFFVYIVVLFPDEIFGAFMISTPCCTIALWIIWMMSVYLIKKLPKPSGSWPIIVIGIFLFYLVNKKPAPPRAKIRETIRPHFTQCLVYAIRDYDGLTLPESELSLLISYRMTVAWELDYIQTLKYPSLREVLVY